VTDEVVAGTLPNPRVLLVREYEEASGSASASPRVSVVREPEEVQSSSVRESRLVEEDERGE
jgi:hypothetical protein